jgi:DNA gyrase/topoisomerase IV subunit A
MNSTTNTNDPTAPSRAADFPKQQHLSKVLRDAVADGYVPDVDEIAADLRVAFGRNTEVLDAISLVCAQRIVDALAKIEPEQIEAEQIEAKPERQRKVPTPAQESSERISVCTYLVFTSRGRVYQTKTDSAQKVRAFSRRIEEYPARGRIAQVIQIKSYEEAPPYLVLATRNGLVKKTKLTDFDSNRSGIVAINLRDSDELVGAVLCSSAEDLLLVSANGQSIRFSATDEALRPMGRATSGVQGMRFNTDDELISLNVVGGATDVLVATSGGYAKRTPIEEHPVQGRGGKGMMAIQYDMRRGRLVGALTVNGGDVYAKTTGGAVLRIAATQVRKAGRQTKGVRLVNLAVGDTLLAIAPTREAVAIAGQRAAAEGCGYDVR